MKSPFFDKCFVFLPLFLSVLSSETLLSQPVAAPTETQTTPKLPVAAPEAVGMSSTKLKVVDQTIQKYVDDGEIVGGIVIIARKGKICFFEDYGFGRSGADSALSMADGIRCEESDLRRHRGVSRFTTRGASFQSVSFEKRSCRMRILRREIVHFKSRILSLRTFRALRYPRTSKGRFNGDCFG